ncbi:MAG: DUF2480 family protein [Bacteroidetes bacterium]|nr:DUF2480 family protein [Bacteroidota bacterium]
MQEIVNKVAQSGIVTLNLEDWYDNTPRMLLDIKPWLFQELVLKEKDFRTQAQNHSWQQYQNSYVALTCSADALVPTWAYMLLTSYLQGLAKKTVFGTLENLEAFLFAEKIHALDVSLYQDARVVIKGCSHKPIPVAAYVALTEKLKPVVKSLMFGEPCSTVPLYKKNR